MKPPSLANLDKVNSNSLDLPSSSELHTPHTAKLQDLHPAGGHLTPCFSPSPAPILNINSASFSQGLELMGGFSVPKEGRMYPKLSGLHRSMESLQMPMSLPSAFSGGSTTTPTPAAAPPASTEEEGEEEEAGELGWSGSPRLTHLDRYGWKEVGGLLWHLHGLTSLPAILPCPLPASEPLPATFLRKSSLFLQLYPHGSFPSLCRDVTGLSFPSSANRDRNTLPKKGLR